MASGRDRLSVMVVDDEAVVRDSLAAWLREEGYDVTPVPDGRTALELLASREWDVFLLDIKMPGMDGIELQARIREAFPDASIIVMTAYASVESAVQAMKQGAHDYLSKPFDPADLARVVSGAAERRRLLKENSQLRDSVREASGGSLIVGQSAAIRAVQERIEQVAETDATVLLSGESGTGKEVVARSIHALSHRRYLPIVVMNCGALTESLLESELFGHERGAFTGAQYRRKGRFELADGGTIFLDEVGDISPRLQIDLLRVLEDKQVLRIGASKSVPVDFRTIAATHRDLEERVREGEFREDLFYRLNVIPIRVPPLRERREDIPLLIAHFVETLSRAMNRAPRPLTERASAQLASHDWPGNVRQLRNAVERALVVAKGRVLDVSDFALPGEGGNGHGNGGIRATAATRSLSEIEEEHVRRVLQHAGYNISLAARILAVDRVTLYHKMKRYGIIRPERAPAP